jgi:hypothetical protein
MNESNMPKELLRAALAWFVAMLAGLLLKALGAGRTVTAVLGGAAGGLATLAVT